MARFSSTMLVRCNGFQLPPFKKAMPPKRKHQEKGISWSGSAARLVLLADLAEGNVPLDESACSAEEAWEYYQELLEFKDVPFSQFEKQLEAHWAQMNRKMVRAMDQWTALQSDRGKHPEPTHYDNGKLIFRLTPAYEVLRTDVNAGVHHEYTPSALKALCPEYFGWDLGEFTQRIHQMERQKKFINYLEKQRKEKKAAAEAAWHKAMMEAVMEAEDAKEAAEEVNSSKKQKKNDVE